MNGKPSTGPGEPVHFPTSAEHGAVPFPRSKPQQPGQAKDAEQEEPSAEELRLMADTMPGEGPGDD